MTAPLKRARASASRSRNGCRPCKSRHVRCDEAQPACVNCTRLGIYCHGQGGVKPVAAIKTRPRLHPLLPQPRTTPQATGLLITPSYYASVGADGIYFDAFRQEVIHDIAGMGYEDFWTRTVSKSSPSIRLTLRRLHNKNVKSRMPRRVEDADSVISSVSRFNR